MSHAGALQKSGAQGQTVAPGEGSAREGYADLLALAVLRSARLHFTQPRSSLQNRSKTVQGRNSRHAAQKKLRLLDLQLQKSRTRCEGTHPLATPLLTLDPGADERREATLDITVVLHL